MKRVAAIITCLSVFSCLIFAVPVKAESNIISFEKYAASLIDAYAEYGVEVEPIRPDNGTVLTEAMLATDLLRVPQIAAQIKASSQTVVYVDIKGEFNHKTRAIYGTATGSDSVFVTGGDPLFPRNATIKVTASVYANLNSYSILEAYAPSLRLTRATGFADYIRRVSYSSRIDNSSSTLSDHNVKYTINCELKEETSLGGVSSWAKVYKTIEARIKPF